jgi:hypothetical protein
MFLDSDKGRLPPYLRVTGPYTLLPGDLRAAKLSVVHATGDYVPETLHAAQTFARQTRKRLRFDSGGYRRAHLRALAQRVAVDAKEGRIMGSKSEFLRALVAASNAKTTVLEKRFEFLPSGFAG